ncbi:hypothetical protein T439DRAFT_51332 [Meredithblackwellia eburnea MCA 4105]
MSQPPVQHPPLPDGWHSRWDATAGRHIFIRESWLTISFTVLPAQPRTRARHLPTPFDYSSSDGDGGSLELQESEIRDHISNNYSIDGGARLECRIDATEALGMRVKVNQCDGAKPRCQVHRIST